MPIVSKENAEHYVWGGNCDGWHLMRSETLSVIQECMPPGATATEHSHERARQFFFVLSGRLAMAMDGEVRHIGSQQGLEIAPGVRHHAFNDSMESVEFVLCATPPAKGDRINLP